MSTTNLTDICMIVISLISAVVSAFVIPWLKKRTTQQERETMLSWVEIAVAAAQQLYHDRDGKARKKYVLDFLREKGYTVNETEIDAAIEAEVLRLHRQLEAGSNE